MESIDDRISRALDSALEMTFPASDPIAVYMPAELREDETHDATERERVRMIRSARAAALRPPARPAAAAPWPRSG